MLKRLFGNAVLISIVTVILYYVHSYLLSDQGYLLAFSLMSVYIFHAVAYMIICLLVEVVATRLPTQAGYAYLTTVFVKIGVFVLVFKDSILSRQDLPMADRLSLVVPMFIYLILEALYCGRLLNSK